MTTDPESTIRISLTATVADSPPAPTQIERDIIELYDAFGGRLFRYVYSFGVSSYDSEEITQDVFLSLFHHLRLGRSRSNLRGWIFRVAHNLALKKQYANQRTQNFIELDDEIANRQIDLAPNPEEQVTRSEQRNRLHSILRALPEQDQRCLFLRSEGLPYREIAKVLGISLGSVSMSITRSLARLGSVSEE